MTRAYDIKPRPPELGGGWKLTLFEDAEEAGGGVFPPTDDTEDAVNEAFTDAQETGDDWVAAG